MFIAMSSIIGILLSLKRNAEFECEASSRKQLQRIPFRTPHSTLYI
jgi:hypothetical protein